MLVVYCIIGGCIFVFMANNNDFPQDIFKGPYIPLDNWITIVVLLAVLMPALCLVFKFLVPVYTLFEDRLVIQRNYAGEVSLPLSELQNWQYRPSKGGRSIYSTYVALVFTEKTVRIEENSISNLSALADILKQKQPQLETGSKSSNTAINAFVNFLYMAVCFSPFIILSVPGYGHNEDKNPDVKHLLIKLSGDPEFIVHTHKSRDPTYVMVLRSADIGDFALTFNFSTSSKKEEYTSSFHAGDTVPINILQHDYDVKISKKQSPDFWEKHIAWQQTPIQELWYVAKTERH
jgi:hypothetical protein